MRTELAPRSEEADAGVLLRKEAYKYKCYIYIYIYVCIHI